MDLFAGICMAIAAICLLAVAYIAITTKKRTGHYPQAFVSDSQTLWLPWALVYSTMFLTAIAWIRPVLDITLCIVALMVVVRRLHHCFMPDWNWRWALWQSCSLLYLFWAAFLLSADIKASINGFQWILGGFVSCFVAPYAVRYLGTEEPVKKAAEKKSLIILP
ncbi:MAG: hypothetical protein NT018_07145 [Armatimonadetes bacterium]|nr:hypothetical protein [Armatimonadota bacterium]